jgi:hypothetical protein
VIKISIGAGFESNFFFLLVACTRGGILVATREPIIQL